MKKKDLTEDLIDGKDKYTEYQEDGRQTPETASTDSADYQRMNDKPAPVASKRSGWGIFEKIKEMVKPAPKKGLEERLIEESDKDEADQKRNDQGGGYTPP